MSLGRLTWRTDEGSAATRVPLGRIFRILSSAASSRPICLNMCILAKGPPPSSTACTWCPEAMIDALLTDFFLIEEINAFVLHFLGVGKQTPPFVCMCDIV